MSDPRKIEPPRARKAGIAHGLLVWFDAILTADIGFSNTPGNKNVADVYGRGFFPFLDPVSIARGCYPDSN